MSHITADVNRPCPICAEPIKISARKCIHCGEFLDPSLQTEDARPGIAAVLSFFIPGLGQIYRGKVGPGVAWLVCTLVGYAMFVVPGLIVHVLCVVSAYSGSTAKKSGPKKLGIFDANISWKKLGLGYVLAVLAFVAYVYLGGKL